MNTMCFFVRWAGIFSLIVLSLYNPNSYAESHIALVIGNNQYRNVGIPDEEDDSIPFDDKMNALTATLAKQIAKEKELDEQLQEQLAKVGFAL